jgi:hypothetical protein
MKQKDVARLRDVAEWDAGHAPRRGSHRASRRGAERMKTGERRGAGEEPERGRVDADHRDGARTSRWTGNSKNAKNAK